MTQSRLLTITAAIAALIISVSLLWPADRTAEHNSAADYALSDAADKRPSSATPGHEADAWDETTPLPGDIDPQEYREQEQQRLLRAALQARIEEAHGQPGNLQRLFGDIQRLCANHGSTVAQCEAAFADSLAEHPDRAFADMIERILARMPAYEEHMQSTVMSTDSPPRERYQVIHEQRQQLLGVEETEAMFGQERAMAEFRFAYGDLLESAPQMDLAQRQEAIESLREQTFAEYAEILRQEEGLHGAYQHDLRLMLAGIEDSEQQARITRQLREQYFDSETIARMETRDRQQAEQTETVSNYQQALEVLQQEFNAKRDTMDDTQWQAEYQEALQILRLEHFSD